MTLSKANEKFDTCLKAVDWRYSAAIVGLYKYFVYYKDELEYVSEHRDVIAEMLGI